MDAERKIIRNNAIFAGACFLFSLAIFIAFFFVYPRPLLADLPSDVRTKIQIAKIKDTQGIEWLRAVALQYDAADRQNNRKTNELLDDGIYALIVLGIAAGLHSLFNIGLWMKFIRIQHNQNIPWWLRWI